MSTVRLCGLKPMLFGRKSCAWEPMKSSTMPNKPSKVLNEGKGESIEWSFVGADQLILMMKVYKKIFVFRDIMDLAPLNSSASLHEMVITTLEDMQRLYPGIISRQRMSDIKAKSIDQGLAYFCEALKSLGEFWMMNNDGVEKHNYELPSCKDNIKMPQLGETMLATLDCLIDIASEKFDIMEEDDPKKEFSPTHSSFGADISNSSFPDSKCSPLTPKSVLPEPMNQRSSITTSPLSSLRIQAVGKLNPIDLKHLSFHMSPAHMQNYNNKIEKEPTLSMEMDHKSRYPVKDTSQDVVFDLDTTGESLSDRTRRDHGITYNKPQAMGEVEISLSPKPLETPSLQQKALGSAASSPSPPLIPTPPPPPPPPPPPLPTLHTVPLPVLTPPVAPLPLGSSPSPPPPPVPFKGGSVPAPPPPTPRENAATAPPPPPPGVGRSLRPKATTKLKRSTQLGNLYRTLKGKVEGSSLKGKSSSGRSSEIRAGNTGGKQGMADALAEMTKRSSYFQRIEEDVQRYTKHIIELRFAITNFKTNEMTELIKFHEDVESVLENLTDESQVLSRFEGFPSKKLEAIRMAAALYHRLDSILTELQNWNIVTPVGQLLEKIERYFSKIKTELDALERTKDEESKKFEGHNIEFNFDILIKIKEAMVDVSSNCMELALKERRNDAISDVKRKEYAKLLWRAFQFAFRVYTFAGGHDDRADKLTRELAKEIESDPNKP
ncbi:uncharacterized protein At4g04980-like [Abrus precatorius]|uniref:Uncharacterized protein At4g04980-like n=1 Tax=Abrus precatorius TaxID=3816 RepID=A0A8B8K6M6_ABRPR|nr:uncharacterized protein At4g04980-like [Abrus precatorius]